MLSCQLDDHVLTLDKRGSRQFTKVSYPIRYGRFAEIQTPEALYQVNLNGEIKYLQGRDPGWPHAAEWLKRTAGNDWIYYSSGDYKGVYELFGEYYVPCLSYQSNSLFSEDPFDHPSVKSAIRSWEDLLKNLRRYRSAAIPEAFKDFITRMLENDADSLGARSEQLHHLLGGPVTVLPPDTRHVDYDVIPVIVADGCVYHCGFCGVKSGRSFSVRSRNDILTQITRLREFYGDDRSNYNSIFLGQHDALRAGRETIEFAASRAYDLLDFGNSTMKEPRLFLFGSVDALLESEEATLRMLNELPFYSTINVGFESADTATLKALQKPLTGDRVRGAFHRMQEINQEFQNLEVTANFVLGEGLPPSHFDSLSDLTANHREPATLKGAFYLSPLLGGTGQTGVRRRRILKNFNELKTRSPVPTFLYLIQRL
jgi:hypothetical protein